MENVSGSIDISGVKRCYVEGLKIKFVCPYCKKEQEYDHSDQYLSYPVVGKEFDLTVFCKDCDDWAAFTAKVTTAVISIEFDPSTVKEW